ncbi:xanthine dehydrogenase small subunit [Altericista sp. CCNU0014]|uniref:xanthine dehydrogenase small subunit n=1 Tax=Altericista sp. CCNU0014 TaxID=3082949 RepID=UPI00384C92CC
MVEYNLTLSINGQTVDLAAVSPTTTLLQYLHQSGRTGTKEGCGDGDCGACTVAVQCTGADGQSCYRAMNSCLIPLGSVANCKITTVEGLADAQLHPVQAAMVQTGGSQCGYCTPGFVMSLFAAYYSSNADDIAIEGNLCRCTGYVPIRKAAALLMREIAETKPRDRFTESLAAPAADLEPLYYASHGEQFYRPTQLSEVLELLQQHSDATLIAGGTDLGLDISHQRRQFPVLISVEGVASLKHIRQTEAAVEIGAAVPLSCIQSELRGVFPSLDEMLFWFAACQVRNRATLGGNIGTASPIGDLPPVLLSLDAELNIAGSQGNRTIPLADFFKGYRQTDLNPGEVIVSVKIPVSKPPGTTQRFSQSYKVGKRGTDDISIVAAAFTVDLDATDRIVRARLAYGGVAAVPARAIAVESALLGQPWTIATVHQVKPLLRDAFDPLTDLRGSAAYRKTLVANLFEKFFVETSEGGDRNGHGHS